MLSAHTSEQEVQVDKASSEPQPGLSSREPSSEKPRGSGARKWIVLLIIVVVVGAAVWKIRRNAQEQDSLQLIIAAQAERPTPVQVAAVQQKTMPIFLTALRTLDGPVWPGHDNRGQCHPRRSAWVRAISPWRCSVPPRQ